MQVEVKSYTKKSGALGCCARVEYATFQVDKGVKSALLRWNLVTITKASFVFNPGDGVRISNTPPNPQPNPLDFEQPTIGGSGQWYMVPARNGRDQRFDYFLSIFRNDMGDYTPCDLSDPVIFNQGD
jgi:hypothetical protein